MITTGMAGLRAWMRLSASMPSMVVMRTSMRMTSQGPCSTAATAVEPSSASSASQPHSANSDRSMKRCTRSSSTMRIFALVCAPTLRSSGICF